MRMPFILFQFYFKVANRIRGINSHNLSKLVISKLEFLCIPFSRFLFLSCQINFLWGCGQFNSNSNSCIEIRIQLINSEFPHIFIDSIIIIIDNNILLSHNPNSYYIFLKCIIYNCIILIIYLFML